MAVDLTALLADLTAEAQVVDCMLAGLPAAAWQLATPAEGWSIADQVSHLAYFDDTASLAATDPDRFRAEADELMGHGPDFAAYVAEQQRGRSPAELLGWVRGARHRLVETFTPLDPGARLPWYGPPMSVASATTARLMETWAHGRDIADTLGADQPATDRLRHVAHLGVATLGFAFEQRGLAAPGVPVRVELTAPDGTTWTWGPEDAAERVSGPALDFCLVVTQRRHVDDTALVARGAVAALWLRIGQAYAGPPGPGRTAAGLPVVAGEPGPGAAVPGPPTVPRDAGPGRVARGPEPRPVRIANCSGFYGDHLAAAREMVEGGPIDVLTGDYLAELTMLILWKAKQKDPAAGYATTFLAQMEQVLGTCLDRGIRVVVNAGGLNPAGLAAELATLAGTLGLAPRIAYVEGDDLSGRIDELVASGHELRNLDTGASLAEAGVEAVTANAYLGGWGIAEALGAGADVVVCPRVTDASLVVGPAAWWHGWGSEEYDALAGAVAAGHVIECGPQATGGNYAFIDEITDRRYPGFPLAEVASDGSTVITKHPGTGGLVSVGTVTAQLLYEVAGPEYLNPDVVAHFDTVSLEQVGPDRVRISGTRGTPPTPTLKVALNYLGGYRNTMTLVLTGLDIEAKAAWATQELFETLGGRERFDEVDVRLLRFDHPDAPANELATAHLRITVKSADPGRVGRAFSRAVTELTLASYAGLHTTSPPTAESSFGVYWPALVPAEVVEHAVVLPDGTRRVVPHPERTGPAGGDVDLTGGGSAGVGAAGGSSAGGTGTGSADGVDGVDGVLGSGGTVREALGRICGARSGDKGGNANVGLWTADDEAFAWLRSTLTVDRFRELVPEAAGLDVYRYELPNLRALNFVVVGLLGDGVAASTRPDPQAKGLGEYVRSRTVDIPVALLRREPVTERAPGRSAAPDG